jgi:hypothetical protein
MRAGVQSRYFGWLLWGADERYIEALAKAAVDHGESAAYGPKNVTIFGLP